VGVEYDLGRFANDLVECSRCTHEWNDPKEKESDINLALAVVHDAHRDLFDTAFILTADGDQAATARYLRAHFPQKNVVSIVPPGMNANKAIGLFAKAVHLNEGVIAQCLFPEKLDHQIDGKTIRIYTMPPSYAPPLGWTPAKQQQIAAARRGSGVRSKVLRGDGAGVRLPRP
jgi:hypothetical protein